MRGFWRLRARIRRTRLGLISMEPASPAYFPRARVYPSFSPPAPRDGETSPRTHRGKLFHGGISSPASPRSLVLVAFSLPLARARARRGTSSFERHCRRAPALAARPTNFKLLAPDEFILPNGREAADPASSAGFSGDINIMRVYCVCRFLRCRARQSCFRRSNGNLEVGCADSGILFYLSCWESY